MKNLILKAVLFCSLMAIGYFLLVDKLSKGFVDMTYLKFTQEAGSLVIGLSRADLGIDPQTVEEQLIGFSDSGPLINFASNQYNFGETYLNAIKKKLNSSPDNRIFIITVSPGSFTAPKGFGAKGILSLDSKTAIGKTKDFTSYPNYSYIINCYGSGLYTALIENRDWDNLTPHDNGWNEISLESNSTPIGTELIEYWKRQNLAYYGRKLSMIEVKPYRKEWFVKTIEFLQSEGSVYLVRMPVDQEILNFENQSWEGFSTYIQDVASERNIPYFDYSHRSGRFATYDGSHLYSETAKEFSAQLAQDIQGYDRAKDGFDP